MGWILTALEVALVIVVVAGVALALCRYCIGWQWGTRNVWNVCEEWRQKVSWLWAPREEKVGLVKAQHPPAQTIPGLYRQPGNASQHLLHSDSDLRLDAQGAFTRFESVDKDLHPPQGATASPIPPQPLRPAPQPKPIARPRPTPLQSSSTVDHLRMQEANPGPLTPPPQLQRGPRSSGPSIFLFQSEPKQPESIQMTPYITQNHMDSRLRYELDEERRNRCNSYELGSANLLRQYESESTRIRYGVHGAPLATLDGKEDEDGNGSYGSYDIVQSNHMIRQHVRNDSRGSPSSFGMTNSSSASNQTVMGSIYRPEALSKMLQSTQSLGNDPDHKSNDIQSIEMTPFRSSSLQDDIGSSYLFRESQGLQKVSQYIQSLPDLPIYDSMGEFAMHPDQEHVLYDDTFPEAINAMKVTSESASSPIPPPPPAPPDPPKDVPKKNGLTTGERIFNALKLVTSQSYIDATEFYSSVVSTAQQLQPFSFSSRSPSLVELQDIYEESDPEVIGPDDARRSSDLYNAELNLEAHRTAQEVYNSLQNPPASPLLLKDHNQLIYMTDPSFIRTSEDILNRIEERKKSMERLNDIHHTNGLDDADTLRMRMSQEFYSTLDGVPLKRRPSQNLEDAFITNYSMSDFNELSPGCRRGSQGPEPEPPPKESKLKRAISCESVCSDTSPIYNEIEEARIVGHVCVGVEYDRWVSRGAECDLAISILEARDLVTPDGQPAQDTFARVCLFPDTQRNVRTRICRGSASPSYQEKFMFPRDGCPVDKTLRVEVFCVESRELSLCEEPSLLGEACLRLDPLPRAPATTWLPLIGSSFPLLGELFFSLSYSPTAERLTLVVVKARNLCGVGIVPGDVFVKVYLLQQGQKVQKKKTSIKRGESSPTFNELMFFSVSTGMLQNTQLRIAVMAISSEQGTKPYTIGHVIVGSTGSEMAVTHWRHMLNMLRHPISMWHPLRKPIRSESQSKGMRTTM